MAEPALASPGPITAPPSAGTKYAAFISYSHAVDDLTARALQRTLEYYGMAVRLFRRMRVFRDESSLAANPDLWGTIQAALDASDSLLLLASPGAAASQWVRRELAYFLEHHGPDCIALVLTEGWTPWTDKASEQDPQRKAVPAELAEEFQKRGWEPLVVDLRPFRGARGFTRGRSPEFVSRTASIVALALRKEKEEVLGTHLRAQRQAIAGLVLAGLVLAAAAGVALVQRAEAVRQRDVAFSGELAANAEKVLEADPQLSLLLIKKAASLRKTEQVHDAQVADRTDKRPARRVGGRGRV